MLGRRTDMWFTPLRAPGSATSRDGAVVQPSMPEAVQIADRLEGLTADEQVALLSTLVREQLAVVLGHDTAERVPADREFAALGVDSLAAVEVRNRLSALTDLRLPATVLFDYTTPEALAAHLSRQLAVSDTA
jgi:acyl carrier protein